MLRQCMAFGVCLLGLNPVFANWQVQNESANPDAWPHATAGRHEKAFLTYEGPRPAYAISVAGSLKQNLMRIMSGFGWRVVWLAPYDFNFDGKIEGITPANVIDKLLAPFPLKAVMFAGNKTLTIYPKNA